MSRAPAPLFHEVNGAEYALGPLEAALVRAVLGAAAKMRGDGMHRNEGYQIHLHVRNATVVVQVVQHVGNVAFVVTTAARD